MQTREARKKQAAENVAAEKQAYGDISAAESDEEEQIDSGEQHFLLIGRELSY